MQFFSRSYSASEPADSLPASSLVRVHQTLYGGVGADSTLTLLPSEVDIGYVVEACYELDAVYENPLFTFYDRPAITQAFLLSRFVSSSRLPLPSQVVRSAVTSLGSLLGLSRPKDVQFSQGRGWELVSVWSEFGDIAESESFDGSHLGILSHTIHVSLLPSLPLVGNRIQIRLRTLSLLQFNEGGLITFHRDHWDVRDLIEGCVPGVSTAGAMGRWLAGWGARVVGAAFGALSFEEVVSKVMLEKETDEVKRVVREEVRELKERVAGSPKFETGGISSVAFPSHRQPRGSTTSLASSTSPQSPMTSYLRPTTGPPPLISPGGTTGGSTRRRRKTISRPWGSGSFASSSSLAELMDQEQEERSGVYVDEESRNALGFSRDGGAGEGGGLGHAPDVDEGENDSGWR